jgi:DNA-binding MarR family transcriptional regulator
MSREEQLLFLVSGLRDRAHRFIQAEFKQRGIKGVEPSHGAIVSQLYLHGPLPMSRLALLIGKRKATVTALVKKLMKHGYVEQGPDPEDGRVTLVSLTAKSLALKADFLDISRRMREIAYQGFSSEERKQLIALLDKAIGNFQSR